MSTRFAHLQLKLATPTIFIMIQLLLHAADMEADRQWHAHHGADPGSHRSPLLQKLFSVGDFVFG